MTHRRTTFFTVIAEGPSVPVAHLKQPPGPDWEAAQRLFERARLHRTAHRAGHWSAESLQRLAQRHCVHLVSAYSLARDAKGFIQASRRDIITIA